MALNRFGSTLADVEREHILETLDWCDGNRTRTAKFLDISVRCLRMKLRDFGQSVPGRDACPMEAASASRRSMALS